MAGILFIISGPSGSSKSTLVNEVRRIIPKLEFSVSYTTRAPRGSEKDGLEYHFVTREEFERMIKADDFLEYAEVFGNYYGTAKRFLHEAADRGNDLLLDIDVQGAAQMKAKVPDCVSILVLPPSRQILEKRLRNRSVTEGSVSDEVIERRLQGARKEIENFPKYDYILVNDRLEESVDCLEAIILSERRRRAGMLLSDEEKQAADMASECLQKSSTTARKLKEVLESFSLPTQV